MNEQRDEDFEWDSLMKTIDEQFNCILEEVSEELSRVKEMEKRIPEKDEQQHRIAIETQNQGQNVDLASECYAIEALLQLSNQSNQQVASTLKAANDATADEANEIPSEKIARCIKSLEHASRCVVGSCLLSSCHKMKLLMSHGEGCWAKKETKKCKLCSQLFQLVYRHEKGCLEVHCPVIFCAIIKKSRRTPASHSVAIGNQANANFVSFAPPHPTHRLGGFASRVKAMVSPRTPIAFHPYQRETTAHGKGWCEYSVAIGEFTGSDPRGMSDAPVQCQQNTDTNFQSSQGWAPLERIIGAEGNLQYQAYCRTKLWVESQRIHGSLDFPIDLTTSDLLDGPLTSEEQQVEPIINPF